ncbi:hypothetical protein J1605_021645 [Eschrichtius robustus]|uniref:Uncharacterized protein n=1 Tax=Eschrichtius robustus TaxID=9764 RepID=A0AB34HAW6_ESCRO|nr:hypothetical protein J1605_021645 [Eschrichtius robustus]
MCRNNQTIGWGLGTSQSQVMARCMDMGHVAILTPMAVKPRQSPRAMLSRRLPAASVSQTVKASRPEGTLELAGLIRLEARSMADSPREGKVARPADFTQLIDMASEFVGGKILFATDDFFAPAENLIKVL